MSKLSPQDEKELISFIKNWLKAHGYSQKDLANELNIKSSRTSEIILKIKELNIKSNRTSEIIQKFKEFHKKGGFFKIAKNLIKIEQNWLNNIKADSREINEAQPYNQLDLIDSVVNQINRDISE